MPNRHQAMSNHHVDLTYPCEAHIIILPNIYVTLQPTKKLCSREPVNSLRLSDAYMLWQTIIGSDKGLLSGRCQAIIWTNAGILLMGPLGINFSEILTKIYTFLFRKMHLKMSSGKWRPSCLGLNVLTSLLLPGSFSYSYNLLCHKVWN